MSTDNSQTINLQISNLTVGYTEPLINHINLSAKNGDFIVLTGLNGCGKSTLLNTILYAIKPLEGEIFINEKSIYSLTKKEISKLVSIVFTQKIEVDFLKVIDVLKMGRIPYLGLLENPSKEEIYFIENVARQLEITHLLNQDINKLSDGQEQKVMIARALIQDTPIILFDEPTSFLDFKSKTEAFSLFQKITQDMNKIIIVSTHDIELTEQYATTYWIVKNKEITNIKISVSELKNRLLS